MPLNLRDYYEKNKDYYGADTPLEEVGKEIYYRGGFDQKFPDFNQFTKAAKIDGDIRLDNEARRPKKFEDRLRAGAASAAPGYLTPTAQNNLENRNEFTRGVLRGTDTLQATGYGFAGLVGSAIGSEGLKKAGFEGYKRNIEEAGENPASVKFDDLSISEPLKAARWAVGAFGELVPSMAEGAVTAMAGAAIGSAAAPGAGTAAGAVGGFFGKATAKKLIAEAAEAYIKKGMTKEAAETLAKQSVAKVAQHELVKSGLRNFGAKAGIIAGVTPLEAGGNWAEVMEETGVDNPVSAMATGLTAAFLELAGGNSRLIGKFLGTPAETAFKKALSAGDTSIIARIAKEALISGGGEYAQEAGQEFMSLVNTAINDPTFKMLSVENIKRLNEAGWTGAVGGGVGGVFSAATQGKGNKKDQDPDAAASDVLKRIIRAAAFNEAIDTGLKTGKVGDNPFTADDAIDLIKRGKGEGIYTADDLDLMKERYPQLKDKINSIIATDVTKKVDETIKNPPDEDATANQPGPTPPVNPPGGAPGGEENMLVTQPEISPDDAYNGFVADLAGNVLTSDEAISERTRLVAEYPDLAQSFNNAYDEWQGKSTPSVETAEEDSKKEEGTITPSPEEAEEENANTLVDLLGIMLEGDEKVAFEKKLEDDYQKTLEPIRKQISDIDNEIAQKERDIVSHEDEIRDWSSRVYKDNDAIIKVGDDGGFNDLGTKKSITEINEGRRKRVITNINEAIKLNKERIAELNSSKESILQKNPDLRENKPVIQPETPAKRIYHFTKKENVQKILDEGFDTKLPPLHGTGANQKRESYTGENKTGKDVLYFTTDKKRWSKASVYVGEGKGSEDYSYYDYKEQKWNTEKGAMSSIDLSPVEADIKAGAKTLTIDSLEAYADFQEKNMGRAYYRDRLSDVVNKAKEMGYDIVNIKHVAGEWNDPDGQRTKSGELDWYEEATGASGEDDYFVLNKDILNLKSQPESAQTKEPAASSQETETPALQTEQEKGKKDEADSLGETQTTAEEPVADIMKEIAEITDDELDVLLDEVIDTGKKVTPASPSSSSGRGVLTQGRGATIPSPKKMKDIDTILAEVAKEGVMGVGDAFKGLYELFGGSSLKSFPGGFDEETYAKAKPHFEAALQHFINVGKGLKDFATTVVKQFGDAVRPYLKRFIQEKRGVAEEETAPDTDKTDEKIINLDENTGKGEKGSRTRRKLSDQEKDEREAKKAEAEAKKAKQEALGKFENVGYVYDPEKINARLKDKPPKSGAKILLEAMRAGQIFQSVLPDDATPGARRMLDGMQKMFRSFNEFLFVGSDRLKYEGYGNEAAEKRIDRWISVNNGTIDKLKEWAQAYGTAIQPIVDAFRGQTSIVNIIGRLQNNLGVTSADGETIFTKYDDLPAENPLKRLYSLDVKIAITRTGIYDLITKDWQTLIADENDVLLSEINVHKRRGNKEISRTGLPNYRKDSLITNTEEFSTFFGFKGVGFGEVGWINQEERSRVVNAAYDAFLDLAATIGAPVKGMSLGGELAVQFANLGHKAKGGAAAFFPAVKTINFTRDNGDGTMSHEWGHGIHHMAADDARIEINEVISTFYHVYDFEAGKRYVDGLLAKDSTFLQRLVSNKRQVRIEAVKDAVRRDFSQIVKQETDYYKTATLLDPDYTARRTEMWARAFEAYIYDTMPGRNNYLVSDSVAAGRVGGKASVGTRLVYPAGVERETFNKSIGRLLEGLEWADDASPTLKDDYTRIELYNEQLLKEQLDALLATVEERYKAIWASEPSADGFYWYCYNETSFGPMMQPDGYGAYDKEYTADGQLGTGAVGYLTQLHPDDILDYKLSNIQYSGTKPIYTGEGGGNFGKLQADGETALDEVSAGSNEGTEAAEDIREGDNGSGDAGESGTWEPGKPRGASPGREGDSSGGIHSAAPGNYRITDPSLNDPRNVNTRFSENIAAIRVLKQIEAEKRPAANVNGISEKEILARYSGWGGMAELFSWNPSKVWSGKADIVKAELTEGEIAGAESSSPSAYYTPVPVGKFMWKLAQRLGFKGGIVLDPSLGANGLFFGAMPGDLEKTTTLQGIEMDAVSARIAASLYELSTVENKPFQDVKKPNNRYDLTITNVPFENFVPTDTKYNKGQHKLHNYFINKMLHLTAPGALSMVITSSGTFDNVGSHLTEYAEKADLVGAIRLPSGIFSATDVVTDILVFRKKIAGSKFEGVPVTEWTTAGTDGSTGLTINNYFINHPDMVAGKLEKIAGRYGNDTIRVVGEGDITQALERIAPAFPGMIVEREAMREIKSIDDLIAAPGTVKEGGLYINDKDEICLKASGEEEKLPLGTASEKRSASVARGFIQILDQVRATIRIQKTTTDADAIKVERVKLLETYNAFVAKFGPVNDPKNYAVYGDATDFAWVTALEEYNPDTKKVTKLADIFTKDIAGTSPHPEHAETDQDALAYSLDEFGYPNLEYMARLRDSDVKTVLSGLQDKIVENPATGFMETMDEYLSGNIKEKLKAAREIAQGNPEYERNVKLLEAALPPDIPANRITARIGASWILPDHLSAFVNDKMELRRGLSAVYNFNPISNEWTQSFAGGWRDSKAAIQRKIVDAKKSIEATRTWGTTRRDFFSLMEDALTGRRPVVSYYDPVSKKDVMDVVATSAAESKLQEIQIEFEQWLFRSPAIGDEAVKRFNDVVNTSVPMKADGSHLTFPGKSLWMLTQAEKEAIGVSSDQLVFYPHQVNAVWKYLRNGNIYLAHEVGAGKTVTMALIAMEARRLRGKRKVLYVTLSDSTMEGAISEIKSLYPLANILPVRVSTDEQRKQRALQKMAMNDFDIAIMRQQDLDCIALSPDAERVFIEEELAEHREVLEAARANGARIQEQAIQQAIHALEERLKASGVHAKAKQNNLFFDDIGIDLMIVDEAHEYKNVPFATRLTRITGLNPVGSPTAKAFFRKTQYLNATFPKHDALVFASGTALSNSIAEMYNLQKMLQPQEVKRQGVWSFDRWITNFGDVGSQLEWDGARGVYKNITTIRRIVNAGRMLATAYQNIDSVRAKDTPIKRPVIRGGEPKRVVISPNQYVEDYKQIILARCRELDQNPKNAEYEGTPDMMLRIISNMSKVAIDQRLDRHYANTEMQQDSKIAVSSKIIHQRWQEEKEHSGVQLVFADLGIPKKFDKFKYKTDEQVEKLSDEKLIAYNEEKYEHENSAEGFNTYDGLKQELVRLGIPRDQIAFIHDADDTNKYKKAGKLRSLYRRVNDGDIRVLVGSTSKAGTGVNIQKRVSDVHHLDVWWNYSAWEQRNGRGIRAGNIYADLPGTYIWNYVTETTVDATRWDKIFAKGKVLNAVLGGDINIDVIEDISEETMSAKMMAADASGDPLMSQQATLLQDVQILQYAQAAYLENVRTMKMELAAIPGKIATAEQNILDYKKSHDLMQKVTAVRFIGDDNTYVFEKHGKEIIAALEKAVAANPEKWEDSKKVPLLVFGSHTEKEVVEKVDGKEKKVKKYTIIPLPVSASITGQAANSYGRRILLSGDILSSDRQLAAITFDEKNKAVVELTANISRTVTEYVSMMESSEIEAHERIEKLKKDEPKLKNMIGQPWAKLPEFEEKSRELREINQQMSARGQSAGNPETGIPIDKYQSVVPALEDVAPLGNWYEARGIVYAGEYNPHFGISRSGVDFKKYQLNRAKSFEPSRTYSIPDEISIIGPDTTQPVSDPASPIAYTTTRGTDTVFWVPIGNGAFATVDPNRWSLMQRMIGKDNDWYYVQNRSENFLVHMNKEGQRDAFIKVDRAYGSIPSGVKALLQSEGSVSPAFSRSEKVAPSSSMSKTVVEQYADQLVTGKNVPKVVVVDSASDLPFNAPANAKGAFHNGTVYLVNNNISSKEDAAEAIFHEDVGHFGLRGFFGDSLNDELLNIHDRNRQIQIYAQSWRAKNKDIKKSMSDTAFYYLSIEEAMAKMAQQNRPFTGAKRLLAKVQELLRAIGLDNLANMLEAKTDAEALAMLNKAGMFIKEGKTATQFSYDALYPAFLSAWHGTPHIFAPEKGFPHGRFSLDKIGTGEGAQVYGWGIYFAEEEGTAKTYAEVLSRNASFDGGYRYLITQDTYGNKTVVTVTEVEHRRSPAGIGYNGWESEILKPGHEEFTSREEAVKYLKDNNYILHDAVINKGEDDYIWTVESSSPQLYRLDLPDDVMDKLLDWDKPLSEQSDGVKNIMQNDPRIKAAISRYTRYGSTIESSQDVYHALSWYIGTMNAKDSGGAIRNEPDDRAASEYLASIGIPGNKYLDAMSRGKGEGSHNFVIWDQAVLDRVALLERNGDKLDAIMDEQEESPAFMRADDKTDKFLDAAMKNIKANKTGYKKAKSSADMTQKDWLKNEADFYLQEAMFHLSPNVHKMGLLKKFLTSPEWVEHPVLSRIVRLFVRDRAELYHELYAHLNDLEQPQTEEDTVGELAVKLKHKGLTFVEMMSGKVSKEYQDVWDIIDAADIGNIVHTKEGLAKDGYSEDTIAVWAAFRESYDKALHLMTAQMREMMEQIQEEATAQGIDPADFSPMYNTLRGAIAMMGTYKGAYAPRIRQGDWAVSASRNGEKYREHTSSHFAAQRLAQKLKDEGWKIENVGEVTKIPDDVFQDLKTVTVAKAIDVAIQKMQYVPEDQKIRFNEEILKQVSDMIKARGFRSSMIRRKKEGSAIKGYIEDPIQRHSIYTNNIARGIAKAKVAGLAMREMTGEKVKGRQVGGIDPKKEPEIFTYAKDYIEEQLRNSDKIDRVIGWGKSLATLRFLGFSARAALVNMTAIVTTAPASIHQYVTGGKGSFVAIHRELALASKDAAMFIVGKYAGSQGDMNFLEKEKRLGWDNPQYTQDMTAHTGSVGKRGWATTIDGAMWMFGKTEQWNRLTTLLAAYRLARKAGKSEGEAAELAKTASDKAHGIYNKGTLPPIAWGRNPAARIAQMLVTFTKFSHTYLQMLYDLGFRKHNWKAFSYALIAPMILSGVSAWPLKDAVFMPLIGLILSILGIKDKDEDMEKWLWDTTREHLGEGTERVGRYGAMGAVGLDVSGSLSIGVGIPKDFWEWGGALGGALKEGVKAADELRHGNYKRAAEHLLPAGFGNPVRASREAEEGITTQNKRPVWDEKGRQLMPTPGETRSRGLGFRSTRQAVLASRTWEGHRQQAIFNDKRNDIYESYRAWLVSKDRDSVKYGKIIKGVREFNAKLAELRINEVAPITMKALQSQAKRMLTPAKRERAILQ